MQLKRFHFTAILLIPFILSANNPARQVGIQTPEEERVEEIASILSDVNTVIRPVTDRMYWETAGEVPFLAGHIQRAEAVMDIEVPSMEEWRETYLEYSRTGNRSHWGSLVSPLKEGIRLFTIAEAIENKGRFLPALEQRIREICSWPTWILNAHDHELDNLEGRIIQVDLGVATLGADLASSLVLLGERLDPEVRTLLRENLRKRVLEPFRKEVSGEQEPMFWLTTTNNWNAVCLSGIVVTALAVSENTDECAWYLAASEYLINNFLSGFSADGYCSEGLGYWGYGYGHFIVMTEYLRRVTSGKLDLFASNPARTAGLFPFAIEIVDGVYPAFADCPVDQVPNQTWAWYVARRLGMDESVGQLSKHPSAEGFNLYGRLLFMGDEPLPKVAGEPVDFDPLRQLFSEAGVLVSRAPGEHAFGMAIKAGNNAEHHNHNDVGSYVVVNNGRPILCDPGKEHYTRDTFSENRYKSPVHNSYGHPVPVVDGNLQETGLQASGRMVGQRLEETFDSVIIDMTNAYNVEGLQMLMRAVQFNREARTVTISDSVKFDKPSKFSTTMVTFGQFTRDGNTLSVRDGPSSATVKVIVHGASPVYRIEELEADWQTATRGNSLPQRVEIACEQPVTFAIIKCVIELPAKDD